MIFTCFLLFSC
jgi:hypothetical protein